MNVFNLKSKLKTSLTQSSKLRTGVQVVIGLLRVEVHYPESGSLKTKRFTLQSVTTRLRRQFNVSVAEVEYQNLWQRSVLAVVTVNTDRKHADSALSKA